MRVLLSYGVLTGGGCERRMADLCRWLLDNGDEAWIIASTFDALGESVIHGQCGVPLDRMLYYNTGDGFRCEYIQDYIADMITKLGIDIIDVQWHPGYSPFPYPCKAIATMHGVSTPPPNNIFQGVLDVEGLSLPANRWTHTAVIWNWVNLRRFPFREDLGEGICFAGRAFKNINVKKILPYYEGIIDGYGTSSCPQPPMPANWHWKGFADLAEVYPKYRIVFASAQAAMEALAAGRLVIAGQTLHLANIEGLVPQGCLVTADNIEELSKVHSFGYKQAPEPTAEEVWAEVQKALANDYFDERWRMRQWMEERHSMDKQCGQIKAFYERVLAG